MIHLPNQLLHETNDMMSMKVFNLLKMYCIYNHVLFLISIIIISP